MLSKWFLNLKNFFYKFPFFELLFLLSFIYSQYSIKSINIGFVLSLALASYALLRNKKIHLFRPAFLFLSYCIFIKIGAILLLPDRSHTFNFMIKFAFLTISIFLIGSRIDTIKLRKIWNILGYLAVLGLLYHIVMLKATGGKISCIRLLPFLNPVDNPRFFETHARPLSFFVEPALFTIFIFPIACIDIFYKKVFPTIVFLSSLLLCTSTNGVVYTFIISTFLFIFLFSKYKKKPTFWLLVLSLIAIIFCLGYFTDLFQKTIDKVIHELNGKGTFSNRVLSGFQVFGNMDAFEQMFGSGYRDMVFYMENGFIEIPDNQYKEIAYINTAADILYTFGIIGFIFYSYFIIKLVSNHDRRFIPFVIIFILGMFSQHILNNSAYLLLFTCMFITKDSKIKCMDYEEETISC